MKASSQRYLDKHPEKRKQYQEKYKADGRTKAAQIKSRYGLQPKDVEALLAKQGNVCAVCGEPFTDKLKPYIDHCHNSKKVRGLVHMKCNTLMGLAGDNPTLLNKAAEYLLKHQEGNLLYDEPTQETAAFSTGQEGISQSIC